jgi:hypothetical protein
LNTGKFKKGPVQKALTGRREEETKRKRGCSRKNYGIIALPVQLINSSRLQDIEDNQD